MYIRKYEKQGQNYYLFKLYAGIDPATGKQIHLTRRGFRSQKEAELEYFRLKLAIENEGYSKQQRYTYQEVYDLWLQQYSNTVKGSTLNKTITIFKIHILPIFGKKFIDQIKVNHCQEAVNTWFKSLKGYRSVNSYASLVFRHAMKLGIIQKNPSQLVTMPVKKDEAGDDDSFGNFYTREEMTTFLDSIQDSKKWFTFFRLLAFSGCRKGEALALTWSDINFKSDSITVNKTLTIGMDNKPVVQSPKTKLSRRVLSMDPRTMQVLKEWKAEQAKMMIQFGFNTKGSEQLVFTNLQNKHINPQKVGQILEKYARAAGLRVITPHGFRHTHCSLLFESGASIKEVQDRLGHADIHSTMNIYAHVTEKKKDETAVKFANYMEQK